MFSKNYSYRVALFTLSLLAFWGCTQEAKNVYSIPAELTEGNYFPDKVQIKYAKHFQVTYHLNYKVLRTGATLGDWGTNGTERKDVEDVIVLVQRGTSPPDLVGELAGASLITIPANTIATNNAASEIWLETLGVHEKQVAVGGLKTYNDVTRLAAESGEIGQIGYFWSTPPNMEVLLERQPEILLASISRLDLNQAIRKLRALDVPTAPVFDWAERDYLGRAEWIKYIALFFNLESQANAEFSTIENRVNELKALTAKVEKKPVVIWGNFADKGFWFGNANNAEARFLKDAGLINPIEDFTQPFNPVGEPFTSEEWLEIGQQVKHWIISEGTTFVRLPNESYLEGFRAWRENNLYHHYRRSKPEHDAYDWYNAGIVRPDWVLADLIALFHPDLMPDHDFVFFGNYKKSLNND